jgi:hypothetical protein
MRNLPEDDPRAIWRVAAFAVNFNLRYVFHEIIARAFFAQRIGGSDAGMHTLRPRLPAVVFARSRRRRLPGSCPREVYRRDQLDQRDSNEDRLTARSFEHLIKVIGPQRCHSKSRRRRCHIQ